MSIYCAYQSIPRPDVTSFERQMVISKRDNSSSSTVEVPGNEATGAVGHVEGSGGVREPLGGEDTEHGGYASL